MQYQNLLKLTAALTVSALFMTLTVTAQARPIIQEITTTNGINTGMLTIYPDDEYAEWQLFRNAEKDWTGEFKSAKYTRDENGFCLIFYSDMGFKNELGRKHVERPLTREELFDKVKMADAFKQNAKSAQSPNTGKSTENSQKPVGGSYNPKRAGGGDYKPKVAHLPRT